jgi:hypothetical protein
VSAFARNLGQSLAVAVALSLAAGALIALWQGESVVRWLAYGLDIGGAVMVALAVLSTGGESPRRKFMRNRGMLNDAPARGESRLLVFGLVGIVLVAAGTLFELAF